MSAYAQMADMVNRYGTAEMARVSTPLGTAVTAVQEDAVDTAIADQSSMIDSHLRRKYQVPLTTVPLEINVAVCKMALYQLSSTGGKTPGEFVRLEYEDTLKWLSRIADGKVVLDLTEVQPEDQSYAIMQEREPVFGERSTSYGGGTAGDRW